MDGSVENPFGIAGEVKEEDGAVGFLRDQGCSFPRDLQIEVPEIDYSRTARLFSSVEPEDSEICLRAVAGYLQTRPILLPKELEDWAGEGRYDQWRRSLPKNVRDYYEETNSLRTKRIAAAIQAFEMLSCAVDDGEMSERFSREFWHFYDSYYGLAGDQQGYIDLPTEEKIVFTQQLKQSCQASLFLLLGKI